MTGPAQSRARERRRPNRPARAFTLIELILVMAILTMAVAVTAPTLSHFFRGRTLDSEARRLLAMTRGGQNRAVSEGVPIDLWLDPNEGTYGLEAEPSYETTDPKAVQFTVDAALQIEIPKDATPAAGQLRLMRGQVPSTASIAKVTLTHPNLPTIRFLPDGTVSDSSPQKVQLVARDGSGLWVALAANKLSYEIRTADQ